MEREQVDKMGDMETKQTKWEELSISNDFLFGKVMQNPELCKELLQRILPDLNIERIEYPELQKSINMDMDARSVRLDVYVKDEKEVVYDIEMQVSHTKELAKRSRYYQSMIDLQLIDKGQLYDELKRSYVIFICPFDLYGKGRHIYTFENICKEDSSISMGDETVKIFLNAKGTLDDVSDELKAFLDYVAGKKPKDAYVERLEEAVKEAKKNREWRHEYMTLLMRDQENVKKGREYGEELMLALIQKLVADKRFTEIERMKDDKDYRLKLYREYHII
ncbi:Rpn family recombination-promoting nuclease/putative transposase [Candidatus Ventrimonas sp. KK005]